MIRGNAFDSATHLWLSHTITGGVSMAAMPQKQLLLKIEPLAT